MGSSGLWMSPTMPASGTGADAGDTGLRESPRPQPEPKTARITTAHASGTQRNSMPALLRRGIGAATECSASEGHTKSKKWTVGIDAGGDVGLGVFCGYLRTECGMDAIPEPGGSGDDRYSGAQRKRSDSVHTRAERGYPQITQTAQRCVVVLVFGEKAPRPRGRIAICRWLLGFPA
jgi:hypothetical protein